MTKIQITVQSPTLGNITVEVSNDLLKLHDHPYMRWQIERLLDDAVTKIRGAYGITEESQ
ncbi:hypothetical protein [Prescottella agglutinans]|uniref:Uncharacterized protein n=1 Tax=Prescottella agglutinans TaxID=1644129 RepID=A0ABT6MF03_9NOCA|nr:hypothetical protein [Prescottella agglutinans]MDH6282881.1 hypothetical protein [Prescottella agglutinans]